MLHVIGVCIVLLVFVLLTAGAISAVFEAVPGLGKPVLGLALAGVALVMTLAVAAGVILALAVRAVRRRPGVMRVLLWKFPGTR